MKAVCWYGKHDVRVENVPEPDVLNPRDAVVRVTLTAICGSDLHLYDGFIPTLKKGDILGHEFMGEVVGTGNELKNIKTGDRVVVPFTISCGQCFYCRRELWSLCDNSNPNAWMAEAMYGFSGAGLYGYSHLYGGYAGGQAQYVRVPYADSGPIKVPSEIPDEKVLFLSDIFPTGYMAAENCSISPGDVIAVWGCGPVGQFAIRSAFLLGAERVIAIDREEARLDLARAGGAETVSYDKTDDVVETLKLMTGGRGPDACIDAVGMEAHEPGIAALYDRTKQALMLESDRPHVLREAIQACRKGGVISIPGVYSGFIDKVPMGAAFAKGLTFRMGQTHVQKYMALLLERISRGEIDPSFIISHRMRLDDAPEAYRKFQKKEDGYIKIVMNPFQ
ncbi:MAG TPA: zinc-dependent alcohol dehydrogenase [Syntrophales bacterium]|nr:zinc-dependent alcohol dehydrogenase [Syntrophales bacterium]